MFVRPVLTLDQRSFTEAHVAAFRFFSGTPRRLVPDNLRTGVDKSDLYDPKLNRSYAELADHYGAPSHLAANDKARVGRRPRPNSRSVCASAHA
jgi:transposase